MHLILVCNRMHSYRHTALSEISNEIVRKNITMHYLISHTIVLPMWGSQILVRSTGQSGAETKYGVPTVRGQCAFDIGKLFRKKFT